MKSIFYVFYFTLAFACIALAFIFGSCFIFIALACLVAVIFSAVKEFSNG